MVLWLSLASCPGRDFFQPLVNRTLSDNIHNVSEPAAAIMPIFRSENQLRLLAYIFIHKDETHTAAELARATGVSQPTVNRELARLVEFGLLSATRRGRAKLIQPNRELAYFDELYSLLLKVSGPPSVLAEALGLVQGIESVYIFGSWARRFHGEPGTYPRDVDLLVIGEPDVDAVYAAVEEAEAQLGVEVNPTIVSNSDWAEPSTVFLQAIAGQPRVQVLGS